MEPKYTFFLFSKYLRNLYKLGSTSMKQPLDKSLKAQTHTRNANEYLHQYKMTVEHIVANSKPFYAERCFVLCLSVMLVEQRALVVCSTV